MNIFVLDYDIKKCAEYHCDKHVVKMMLESCQLLCSAHEGQTPYKKTHINHPCAKWTRESLSNYRWLINLTEELINQYKIRFGAHKKPKSEEVFLWLKANEPNINDVGLTKFATAMPLSCLKEDVVESYRKYYIDYKWDKKHFYWRNGVNSPSWYAEGVINSPRKIITKFDKRKY